MMRIAEIMNTLIAAMLEGFKAIGIEKEKEYVEIAVTRLKFWKGEKYAPFPL